MKTLTAEMLVDACVLGEVQVSPDGRYVAYTAAPTGQPTGRRRRMIGVTATDGDPSPQAVTDGSTNDRMPLWSSDSQWLYFLSDRAEPGKSQLYRQRWLGGSPEPLTDWPTGVERFVPLPDNQTVAFLACDPPAEGQRQAGNDVVIYGQHWSPARLRLLNLASGQVQTVEGLGDRHVVEIVPDPAGVRLAVLTWPTPEIDHFRRQNELHQVDLGSGQVRLVCALESGGAMLTWSDDGRRLYFLGSVVPGCMAGTTVFELAIDEGCPRRLLDGLPACPAELAYGGPAGPLVVVAEGLDTSLHRLDPHTRRLIRLSDFRGRFSRLSAGREGQVVAGLWSTAYEPDEVWAGAPAGPFSRLTNMHPEFAGIVWGGQERLQWPAADGLAIDGLLLTPPGHGRADGPLPLVTLVHGGPYARTADSCQIQWYACGQWLAANGYAVLMPNPRGGQGHGHEFAASVAGKVGRDDYQDILGGIDELVAAGVADPHRLGIAGWSQGGFMAAWAVGQTDRFRAAVMGAGISHWGMMVAEGDMQHFEAECGGSTGWEGPGPHPHDAVSPASYVHRVRTPVLILHGENDVRVPLNQGRYFARGLREYGCPHEFVIYPREPHCLEEGGHQLDLLRRTANWFDRWLQPAGRVSTTNAPDRDRERSGE